MRFFEGVGGGEWRAGEVCHFGELAVELAVGLRTGEAGEFEGFVACAGDLIEKLTDLGERVANGVAEGALKALAEGFPVGVVAEHEVVHPAVALG